MMELMDVESNVVGDFDETAFYCNDRAYQQSVLHGYKLARTQNVAILGLARDVAPVLPLTIARIERLGAIFADYRVFIYENDSIDGTDKILRCWSEVNQRVCVIHESLGIPYLKGSSGERMRNLARFRNVVRESMLTACRGLGMTICIVADLDLQGGWSCDGIAHSVGLLGSFDVMASNGLRRRRRKGPWRQFDSWAFREGSWEAISWKEVRHRVPDRGDSLIRLNSAFGGLALYPMHVYQAAEYGGEDCEHVVLHRRLSALGYDRLFLNPSQIVIY